MYPINPKHNTGFILVVCALSTLCSGNSKPNIVLMIADDLGMGDVGCFGNKTLETPNMDNIAAQGVKLTHHLAAASVCTPSRAAFLTGRYPIRMGMVPTNIVRVNMFISSTSGLPPEEVTIAELVKKKGYATALIGKWHLGVHNAETGEFGSHPVKQGFDTFYGLPLTNLKDFAEGGQTVVEAQIPHFTGICLGAGVSTLLLFAYLYQQRYLGGTSALLLLVVFMTLLLYTWFIWSYIKLLNSVLMHDLEVVEQPIVLPGLTDRLVARGREFIEKQAEEKVPFLLVMSWVQVHTALHATRTVGQSSHGKYGDEVMELDWSVGQILDSLRDLDLLDNTLVYFTSDNGGHVEEKGVHGNREGGYNGIYRGGKMQGGMDGGVRVPTVAMWPGVIAPATTIDTPTSMMDVFPTLADILDLSLPADRVIDGQSMLPLLRGEEQKQKPRFLFHYCGNEIQAVRYIPDRGPDVWKLHFATPDWLPGTEGCRFLCQCSSVTWHHVPLLYNIGRDPAERNLCTDYNLCPPLTSVEQQQDIRKTIETAVETHRETLNVSVTNQYAAHRLIPRPWLQPCCNFPTCHCTEGGE